MGVRGTGRYVRLVIFRRGGRGASPSLICVVLTVGRCRRRSFIGDGACAMGGVGREAREGMARGWATIGAGEARRDCSERQVSMMLPKAYCEENVGGLAGGETKRAGCRRGCDDDCCESQERAEGRSIVVSRRNSRRGCW